MSMAATVPPQASQQPITLSCAVERPVLIPLTRGLFALVDPADAPAVECFRWHAVPARGTFYAARRVGDQTIYMHRQLLGMLGAGRLCFVDHVNGDGLDNRRSNIRPCSPGQNNANSTSTRQARGKARGAWKTGNKWAARIVVAGVSRYLGLFPTEQEAGAAYQAASLQAHGNFSRYAR